jgi:histidinol-phosphate aminotransferase
MLASLEDRGAARRARCKIVARATGWRRCSPPCTLITPYPSEANFILCRLDGVDALEVKDRLASRGIFVRYSHGNARNHLRIAPGFRSTMSRSCALREIGAELGR